MSIYWLWVLFNENKDALLQLPTEVKWFIVCALGVCLLSGILSKVWKLISTALILIALYMIVTYFGLF
jgi:hypothetical protein